MEPMVLFLPKLLLNWSLPVPIKYHIWYVFTVDHPDITITDWQRVYKGCAIKPKIEHVMHEFYRKARYGEV